MQTNGIFRKYAPLWAMLFAASTTVIKSAGQRYILKRKWELSWSDAATALGGAVLGYATFRARYGNARSNPLTR